MRAETTELVRHATRNAQENACQEIPGQHQPDMEVSHLAAVSHVAGDIPA